MQTYADIEEQNTGLIKNLLKHFVQHQQVPEYRDRRNAAEQETNHKAIRKRICAKLCRKNKKAINMANPSNLYSLENFKQRKTLFYTKQLRVMFN